MPQPLEFVCFKVASTDSQEQFGLYVKDVCVKDLIYLNYHEHAVNIRELDPAAHPQLQRWYQSARELQVKRGNKMYTGTKRYKDVTTTNLPKYQAIPADRPPGLDAYRAKMKNGDTCLSTHIQACAARAHDKLTDGVKNFDSEEHWQKTLQHLYETKAMTKDDAFALEMFINTQIEEAERAMCLLESSRVYGCFFQPSTRQQGQAPMQQQQQPAAPIAAASTTTAAAPACLPQQPHLPGAPHQMVSGYPFTPAQSAGSLGSPHQMVSGYLFTPAQPAGSPTRPAGPLRGMLQQQHSPHHQQQH